VQISVGCNMACSYCIVPSTRGREVSRPFGELVAEVQRLAADGVREVTLLGQNVNSYGRDLRPAAATFAELLHALDAIDGISRIRYTSPHPKDMRSDVILAHRDLESVCEHVHLPLQSGSSRVLKAMRRTYTRERYLDRVALIREHVPDVALTTDVIVGFPGETEDDFAQTLSLCEEVGYDGAFTFVFSPRRGTEAGTLTEGSSRTRRRSSACSGSSRSSSVARPSARSGSSAATSRCSSRGPRGPTPRAARPLASQQGCEPRRAHAARRDRGGANHGRDAPNARRELSLLAAASVR
jgi:MiaB/RimO family radical SAM methylthiotransferase